MLGPYRYHCPSCDLTSDPFLVRWKADGFGEGHRDRRHDGMHPTGECILSPQFTGPSGRGEWGAVAVFAAVILLAMVSRLF